MANLCKKDGYYIPVLLKQPFSSKTLFYSVLEDWLLCTCPVYKQQNNGTEQSHNNTQI